MLTRQELTRARLPHTHGVAQASSTPPINHDFCLSSPHWDLPLWFCNFISTSATTDIPTDMEFTIKPAKKKKRGKGTQAAKVICELAHCPEVPGHCTRQECRLCLDDETQSLENEKLALAVSLDSRLSETKRLVAEIQKECNLEALDDNGMRSSFVAFKTGIEAKTQDVACKCVECRQKQANLELGLVAKRFAVTQDWLAALREYRSNNDPEAVQRPLGQRTK